MLDFVPNTTTQPHHRPREENDLSMVIELVAIGQGVVALANCTMYDKFCQVCQNVCYTAICNTVSLNGGV